MIFFSPELQRYTEDHTSPEPPLLRRLDRETHLKVLYPNMISGHLQGRVLAMIARMIKPKRILEIGLHRILCNLHGRRIGPAGRDYYH